MSVPPRRAGSLSLQNAVRAVGPIDRRGARLSHDLRHLLPNAIGPGLLVAIDARYPLAMPHSMRDCPSWPRPSSRPRDLGGPHPDRGQGRDRDRPGGSRHYPGPPSPSRCYVTLLGEGIRDASDRGLARASRECQSLSDLEILRPRTRRKWRGGKFRSAHVFLRGVWGNPPVGVRVPPSATKFLVSADRQS